MNIIVQDCDAGVLEVLSLSLEIEGINVLPLRSSYEIISHIEQFSPDAIILDFKLSGTDAIHACMMIKTKFENLPVIASSCNNNIQSEYRKYGFNDYLKKPFDLDSLYSSLKKYQYCAV